MMRSKDPIDTPIKRITSTYMERWRMVFRDLGISDPVIKQIKEQYFHISVREIIYELLLHWERGSEEEPTLGQLTSVLWKNENYKCIDELKVLFKERRPRTQTEPSNANTAANGQNVTLNEAAK